MALIRDLVGQSNQAAPVSHLTLDHPTLQCYAQHNDVALIRDLVEQCSKGESAGPTTTPKKSMDTGRGICDLSLQGTGLPLYGGFPVRFKSSL